ncbi:MAG TPA: class IV adenylate cyclase [Anaerolineales bacterium]|nr:class IV adenylate cyclase [Anaerolineales bacterium]
MTNSGQETEGKFYIHDLNRIRERLEELDARVIQERVLEMNLRFDLPDGSLRAQGRVLRLRRDTGAKLTYKGGSKNTQGLLSRQEIEFVVGDFEKAKQFLEALGYQQVFYYEKYRTTYELDKTQIMLDELPYGDFVEIEGEAEITIHDLSKRLQLNWDAAIDRSYSALFEQVRKNMKLPFGDLSFTNFTNIEVDPSQLEVAAADE